MPLVDIQVIKGVFNDEDKARIIENVTETMVAIEGEALRGVTWVRIQETLEGDWGIGGKRPSAADIQALAKGAA